MTSFTKYTLLDLSDPSLAHQVVTDMTEDLFCGIAVEPIFVAEIQEGGQRADNFDDNLFRFIATLPSQCKGDGIAPSNLWEALEDCTISKGIADAISTYVRGLAAYRGAVAAGDPTAVDAICADLMWFDEDVVEGGAPTAPGARTPAPKFKLDTSTAEKLVDRKAFEGLTAEGYTKILNHKSYFLFINPKIAWVLWTYACRIMDAIKQDPSIWRHRNLEAWARAISGVPPHLIRFTPYEKGRKTAILSLFKPQKDQLRLGHVRLHWSCCTHKRHLDVPEGIVQAIKDALATAPKVPYLASEWTSTVPMFNSQETGRRFVKGEPIPEQIREFWAQEKRADYFECDPYGL